MDPCLQPQVHSSEQVGNSSVASHYASELQKLPDTYAAALAIDVNRLKLAISGLSGASVLAVGSGGSFTAASLLCNLHETYTGRVSRPSTPLEIICNPTLAAASPVFLISAEGKNPDIVEALQRARLHSSRSLHVITNRGDSPLMTKANKLNDISTHVYELAEKDGFLATNSLLLDSVLIARAYGELDYQANQIPTSLAGLKLVSRTIYDWLEEANSFVERAIARRGIIVIFSPLLRPIAADFESKLSESALLYCQVADLRSFAHGRHLWLADRPEDCALLVLLEPSVKALWEEMRKHIPEGIPVLEMPFSSAEPQDLIAGLVAQMHLISLVAQRLDKDPGRPLVPEFGRQLHYADLAVLIPSPADELDHGEMSKYEVLGARWPSVLRRGSMHRAIQRFETALQEQVFRAIVFDYDGTLSSSYQHEIPPPDSVIEQLIRLIRAGIRVGIASGRGDSIRQHLQEKLPADMWGEVLLGIYNCGYISCLQDVPPPEGQRETSEFLSHVTRIVGRLKVLGVPIEKIRTTHPYQVSVRFREGIQAETNWYVIADALRQAGLDISRVVRSKHSVDVLGSGIDKSHLVAHIVQNFKIEPYQILTMGDQGAWPGNDSSLLEHRFSLSVDQPSRRLDRGWKLAPAHKRDVDATLWYLERLQLSAGSFRLDLTAATENLR
jgi:HAD superfamily hydrolase (TIGR01484 family)